MRNSMLLLALCFLLALHGKTDAFQSMLNSNQVCQDGTITVKHWVQAPSGDTTYNTQTMTCAQAIDTGRYSCRAQDFARLCCQTCGKGESSTTTIILNAQAMHAIKQMMLQWRAMRAIMVVQTFTGFIHNWKWLSQQQQYAIIVYAHIIKYQGMNPQMYRFFVNKWNALGLSNRHMFMTIWNSAGTSGGSGSTHVIPGGSTTMTIQLNAQAMYAIKQMMLQWKAMRPAMFLQVFTRYMHNWQSFPRHQQYAIIVYAHIIKYQGMNAQMRSFYLNKWNAMGQSNQHIYMTIWISGRTSGGSGSNHVTRGCRDGNMTACRRRKKDDDDDDDDDSDSGSDSDSDSGSDSDSDSDSD